MKLTSARIQNYKSVEDSQEFQIDQVTCLVGKNESGKTAVLQALYHLNPVVDKEADFILTEYPRRHHSEYKKKHATQPGIVLTSTWEGPAGVLDDVRSYFGDDAVTANQVKIQKGYANKIQVEVEPILDYAAAVRHL